MEDLELWTARVWLIHSPHRLWKVWFEPDNMLTNSSALQSFQSRCEIHKWDPHGIPNFGLHLPLLCFPDLYCVGLPSPAQQALWPDLAGRLEVQSRTAFPYSVASWETILYMVCKLLAHWTSQGIFGCLKSLTINVLGNWAVSFTEHCAQPLPTHPLPLPTNVSQPHFADQLLF